MRRDRIRGPLGLRQVDAFALDDLDHREQPAPAPMMVRVGASSLSMYSTAGVIAFGFISCSACGGSSSSVIRVAAVGEMMLTRISFLRPSSASTFIRPTMPDFAAP